MIGEFWDWLTKQDAEDRDTRITVTSGNLVIWPYVAAGALGAYLLLKKR